MRLKLTYEITTFLLQHNAMKWKRKLVVNNVTGDSVMQISISVMLKRDFGGNMSR